MKKSIILSLRSPQPDPVTVPTKRSKGGKGQGQGNGNSDSGTEVAESNGDGGNEEGKIVPKPVEITKITPEVKKAIEEQNKAIQKELEDKQPEPLVDDCSLYFGGIGVTFNPFDQSVIEAHVGYPAYAAGIRGGDVVISHGEIRGEIGTKVRVSVLRNNQLFDLVITRAKICVERIP